MKKISFVVVMLSLALASCATTKQVAEKVTIAPVTSSAVAYNVNDYYVVYQDGRIYAFDDFKVYQEFFDLGETTFRFTRIGAGPKGETVVFGLRKVDAKKPNESGVMNLYDGKAEGIAVGFYGEVVDDGRIYIFSEWADLQSFIKVGEATFRYTDIGAGPKGETLVYVLNKNNKKKKPVELMAVYKAKHR
ncbi:MAG: hypothetical protein RQ733_07820 [Methyloprofundus sp.]|nr:hypothetical protein [Methyloprofundus sp.]MDT8425869.1 hypothetical protein [Methyloprofundus sp.]